MRLTSELWVKAYIRRLASQNIPAFVLRSGHESAGAIFIKISLLDGTALLFQPAPQMMLEGPGRKWLTANKGKPTDDNLIGEKLAKETSFDPDIWILEVEDRQGRHMLGDELIEE